MENVAVHRIVEQHAAARGDVVAVRNGSQLVSYRDLNCKANEIARHLLDNGFRRGGHALVNMAPGVDLAATLLAVLKAGGAYTWNGAGRSPWPVAVSAGLRDDVAVHQPIDIAAVLQQPVRHRPNLPILTRPTDIACVLTHDSHSTPILVPHATLTALSRDQIDGHQAWDGDPTTFDLWTGLVGGATLSVETAPALRNAA